MYAYKTTSYEELEHLLKKETLDTGKKLDTLEEKLSSNSYHILTRDLRSLIESNIDRKPIMITDGLDDNSLEYQDKTRHVDYAKLLHKEKESYLDVIKTIPLKVIPKIVVNSTNESPTLEAFKKLGFNKRTPGLYVFRGMNINNIKGNLSPLSQDIIYTVCRDEMIKAGEVEFLLKNVLSDIKVEGLDELETFIYNKFYVENKTIMEIVEDIMRQNGIYDAIVSQKDADKYEVYRYDDDYTIYNDKGSVDALNIFNYIIQIKKDILDKIIKTNLSKYQISVLNIRVPEEELKVTRVGCEKPEPEYDIYMGTNKVHLIPYEYEENDTHSRTRRGKRISASTPSSIRY